MVRSGLVIAGAAMWLCISAIPSLAQSLTWLGTLPGGSWSIARAVSADGSVVVGNAEGASGYQRPFIWTQRTGIIDLGTPGTHGIAFGVSADGSVVVGWMASTGLGNYHAFRWENGQLQNLMPGFASEARSVSADGKVVVGSYIADTRLVRSFLWDAQGGARDMGNLDGGSTYIRAVSADGSTAVGYSQKADGKRVGIMWTADGGLQTLGLLPGGTWSEAQAVSANGQVIVGRAQDASLGYYAARWVGGQVESLGVLPVFSSSWAYSVSGDGLKVVGSVLRNGGESHAFLWTPWSGMIDLNDLYADLLTDGSVFIKAEAISSDGRFVVGSGINGVTGRYEGFLIDVSMITAVPEPASIVATGLGIALLALRRRR